MNNPRRIQRHLVKALAAGALLAAAALPMAIATAAGAATVYTAQFSTSLSTNTGPGDSGTFTLTASAPTFAGDGGNATITSSITGVTFTSVVDTSTTELKADYSTSATATAGSGTLTIVDDAGTDTAAGAITVDAAPTESSINVSSIDDNPSAGVTDVTVTGSGFFNEASTDTIANPDGDPTATLTSTVNGTTLTTSYDASPSAAYPLTSGTYEFGVSPFNSVNGEPATPGTYTLTITNPDGGTVTTGAIFTVVGDEVTDVSPSSVPDTAAGQVTSITINGGGFQTGASVYLYASGTAITATPAASSCTFAALTNVALVSADEFTATLTTTAAGGAGDVCDVFVWNGAAGDNLSGYDLAGAIGFGTTSTASPVITSSSLTTGTALTAGAPSTTIVLTGSGFGAFNGTPGTLDPSGLTTNASLSGCVANGAGTTLTCDVFAGDSATLPPSGVEGNYSVTDNGAKLADAFSVGGPAITSIAPAALAVGAPIGTTIAITGTGFSPDTSGAVVDGGADHLFGNFEYVSATSVNFVVTTPPTVAGETDTLAVTGVNAYGYLVSSGTTKVTIDADPTVSSLTYVTGTTGIGIGATAQKLVINGTGFATGATVGSFVNSTGTADPDVTATVTTVTATSITATIAIKTGDTNTIDGYTVTNTDGGSAKVIAVAPLGITIDAAPTITAVSPVSATPSSTNAFTITGTGFLAGAVVTPSSDGTCGTATVASATSITVSCTLGAASSTPVTLAVSNLDGGTAVSGTVLGAVTPPPAFHVGAVHGSAVSGKWVTLTVSGTGFYGQPHVTSTAAGSKIGVTADHGTSLTLHVWTKKGIAGEHTFTITLANGKSGKANYSIKK